MKESTENQNKEIQSNQEEPKDSPKQPKVPPRPPNIVVRFMGQWLKEFFFDNLSLKLASLLCAIILWIFVSTGQSQSEIPRNVLLELKNIPEDLTRVSDVTNSITIKLSGPKNLLRNIKDEDLSYAVDLTSAKSGLSTFKFFPNRFKGLPTGVRVTDIEPSQISIQLARTTEKIVPVQIVTRGEPAAGYIVGEKRATPAFIKVNGAEGEIDRLKSVPTEIIDIEGQAVNIHKKVDLDLVGRHIMIPGDIKNVEIAIDIVPKLESKTFRQVPINVINTDYAAIVRPQYMDLKIEGPESTINTLVTDQIKLVVDASELEPGRYQLKPKLILPQGSLIGQLGLPSVEVHIKKTDKILNGATTKIKKPN